MSGFFIVLFLGGFYEDGCFLFFGLECGAVFWFDYVFGVNCFVVDYE